MPDTSTLIRYCCCKRLVLFCQSKFNLIQRILFIFSSRIVIMKTAAFEFVLVNLDLYLTICHHSYYKHEQIVICFPLI